MNEINLSEKDIMQDILTTEKHGISTYSSGITESSCQNLRNTLVNNFKGTETIQFKVWDAMHQKGWYPTKDAEVNEVNKVKTDATQMSSEIK
ncbi:MAG: spore coat protein [Clostridiaceae bacterium]